ncbi:alkaline phosphatase [Youngiibacter fragilis]|uniref:Alkaline phosphatase n=1 Tax=Youngiibacter fragilis 232.1 TaxID=994573 RepID=V7HZ97_9CLOT|nr:alkaline phosphatase [Youngiibacter fragilis]ETA79305.1 alkaline phosphatase [Youngiibacter fragilis 232.1]
MRRIAKKATAAALASVMVLAAGSQLNAAALENKTNKPMAKNVIVMISDGWGYSQIAATDYYQYGKLGTQVYESFPFKMGMSTYSVGSYDPASAWDSFDYLKGSPTDSAAAATAMSTGEKTYDAAIGVDDDGSVLRHISEDLEAAGKATGVVSSVQFSHATPAGFVAHNASRNNYSDIANEMLMDSATDVIIGAGNPFYDDNGNLKAVPSYKYVGGADTWNALADGTLAVSDANGDGTVNELDKWTLIQEKSEFEALQTGDAPSRLVGVPQVATTLQQSRGGDGKADPYAVPLNDNVPDLATMTNVALNVLDNDEDGFFLMVEGGAIDWAGHANQSGRLIEEQMDFNKAVEAVCTWVRENSNWGETLLIVTGDHETGYLTGPASGPESYPMWTSIVNNGAGVLPGMEWNSGNHTNSIIPLYAKGDAARLLKSYADESDPVRGSYLDNTEIAKLIRQAMNIR